MWGACKRVPHFFCLVLNMQLSKIDTSQLLYDPKGFEFVSALEKIAEFNPDKFPKVDRRQLYIFIILTYDKNSPLWQMFPNFWHKKRIAAITAGFEQDQSGLFSQYVMDLLFGKLEAVNSMIIRYCLFFNEPEFVALVSNYEMFIQETAQAVMPSSSQEKKQIASNIKFLNNEISTLARTVFGGDESLELKKQLYKTATSEILKLRPELVAARLSPDEDDDDDEISNGPPTRTAYRNEYLVD